MIRTKYGKLICEFGCRFYEDGTLKSCKFDRKNIIETSIGKLIPKYQLSETRTRDREAIEFYPNGTIRSVYLEKATNVVTSIGILNCEFITFYESGAIHRIFSTFGKVSGTWSEEDEIKLAPLVKLNLNAVNIYNKLSSICFFEKGFVKSITLFNGEKVMVRVNGGEIETRLGISFYENGTVKSLEPATPILLNTSIGMIIAFDNNPLGIHGDNNSLVFDESGEVLMITTIQSGIEMINTSGEVIRIAALRKPSMLDIERFQMFPIKIEFKPNGINITDSNNIQKFFSSDKYTFSTFYNMLYKSDACCSDCSSCKGCI